MKFLKSLVNHSYNHIFFSVVQSIKTYIQQYQLYIFKFAYIHMLLNELTAKQNPCASGIEILITIVCFMIKCLFGKVCLQCSLKEIYNANSPKF